MGELTNDTSLLVYSNDSYVIQSHDSSIEYITTPSVHSQYNKTIPLKYYEHYATTSVWCPVFKVISQ